MKRFIFLTLFLCLFSLPVFGQNIQFHDLYVSVPQGWTLAQNGVNQADESMFVGLTPETNSDYVWFHGRRASGLDLKAMVTTNGATVTRDIYQESNGIHTWKIIETSKTPYYIVTFMYNSRSGWTYFGVSRSKSSVDSARTAAYTLITFIRE